MGYIELSLLSSPACYLVKPRKPDFYFSLFNFYFYIDSLPPAFSPAPYLFIIKLTTMQPSKFFGMLPCVALLILFIACNNDQDTPTSTDTDTSTAKPDAAAATPTPANTIITSPQSMMIVEQKIGDFEKWLAAYEANDSMRLANGIHKYVIGRGVSDPNTIFIAMKVDDIARAKAYSKSAGLKQAMQKSGAVSAPNFSFTVVNYQDTGMLSAPVRSRTTFTVKDWNTWETVFQKNKTNLAENGLALRAYGHDADDDKKVTIVTAVLDSAKAYAYWKSDILKQRRTESGVIGEPRRFLYQVAKRY